MSPASEHSLWARLGHSVTESTPVSRFNDSVLHHRWVTRTREFTGDLKARLREILHPVILVLRGLRRAVTGGRAWWAAGSKERRRIQAALLIIVLVSIGLLPYGPAILIVGFLCWAGWLGRDTTPKDADPEPKAHVGRLQAVYDGLVPYLHDEHDPDQHFKPGGGYRDAFTSWEFDEHDRLTAFTIDYSQYVRDGESECRAKVERAIEGKVGRGNEFLYDWDEEGNHLRVRVLPPLPGGLAAQPWPVAEIEYVLGITDPDSAGRQVPVLMPDEPGVEPEPLPANIAARTAEAPEGWHPALVAPVVWRVGTPCPNPHLLVTGASGSGKTTALRSLLGQALGRGQQVAVIDIEQTEAYADLAGRPGVRGVVEDPERALELLDWFGLECERRAERRRAEAEAVANGDTASFPALKVLDASVDGLRQPQVLMESAEATEPSLWLCIDGLPELLDAAAGAGRPQLEETLAALARKARYAGVLMLVTARDDRVLQLRPALRAQLTVRVAMGSVEPAVSTVLFGGTLELGGCRRLPAGRGYVRVGSGPVIRLQTPYAPPVSVAPLRAVGTTMAPATAAAPAPAAG
ncbi:FtsK/SpoIIIE domain-containing protein [Actinospica sp.]|uniref:FtsK/SpoIIIE domain-containing protein n=1 Tax=Actinospica sp. TaxID=1872142 RepID=UPI002C343BAD|nr:FtsK/SpoIIIE domain-containing protein [Actinospica sp.]HWG28792.1 FtsK/SpoIIIE domain-containing protein [Actinospica sp.]